MLLMYIVLFILFNRIYDTLYGDEIKYTVSICEIVFQICIICILCFVYNLVLYNCFVVCRSKWCVHVVVKMLEKVRQNNCTKLGGMDNTHRIYGLVSNLTLP